MIQFLGFDNREICLQIEIDPIVNGAGSIRDTYDFMVEMEELAFGDLFSSVLILPTLKFIEFAHEKHCGKYAGY